MTSPKTATGPLADLVVIEMGTLIAGPFAGQILGDFGAEVIKIEDPKVGDPMRQWGRSLPKGLSPWWPVIGRNKKSVGVDLRQPEGQAIAKALIAQADVVIENFRPGAMEKWGLGEAMGGLRYVTGEPDRAPARAGISIGDSLAAMHAVMGITMALHERTRTGQGQVIDAALYESVLGVMENLITEYDITGYVRERSGSVLPGIAPSNAYPCAGGELILIGGNGDNVYARLTEAMGRPDLKTDPKFIDHASRGVNQVALDTIVAEWTSTFALTDLLALLEAKGVPASRVFRAPDMLEDPQFAARETIVTTDHPVFGPIRMQNAFPKLSRTPGSVRWPGPALGQHTDEVLAARAGCTPERLAELRGKGVI
jgi:formyl-CoA transferase